MAMRYNSQIVNDGLILYLDAGNLKSYPGSGDVWYDLTKNGNNANRTNNGGYGGQVTYNTSGYFDYTVNSPASTAGAFSGNGFSFSSMIIPSTNGFSIMAAVRRNPSVKAFGDRETIFSNAGGADGWRFGMSAGGDLYYLIGGAGGVGYQEGTLGGSTLVDDKWHIVTGVFDRAAVRGSYKVYGYIDGTQVGSVTISSGASGNIAFSTSFPGVGYAGCCDVFAGYIGNLMAYNKVLSDSEILQTYNATRRRFGI